MAYGRPMKGKSRRVPFTIHAPIGILDTIDEYVQQQDAQQEGAYTRSDFFAEAALAYLKQKGYDVDDEEVRVNRCKSVAEKSGDRERDDNIKNLSEENRPK